LIARRKPQFGNSRQLVPLLTGANGVALAALRVDIFRLDFFRIVSLL